MDECYFPKEEAESIIKDYDHNPMYKFVDKEPNYRRAMREIVRLNAEVDRLNEVNDKQHAALNEIVERAATRSSDWCRRKAKEGLGLK